jgi:hypothetical protein
LGSRDSGLSKRKASVLGDRDSGLSEEEGKRFGGLVILECLMAGKRARRLNRAWQNLAEKSSFHIARLLPR